MPPRLVRQRRVALIALARGELPFDGFGHAATEHAEKRGVVAIAVGGPAAGGGAVPGVHAGRGRDRLPTVIAEPHMAILSARMRGA